MTRVALRWLLVFAAGLVPAVLVAQDGAVAERGPADGGAAFTAGTESFAREDYAAARDAFLSAIASGSEGPSAWYNLAVSEYRLGRWAEAEEGFRELGRRFPDMRPLAAYNLGLTLIRQSRLAEARDALLEAALAADENLSTLALAMLGRLPDEATEPDRRGWSPWLDVGFGFDDNVQLVDPLALPAGTTTESPFFELSAYAGRSVGDAWQVAASAYIIEFDDASEYDQQLVQVGAAHESRVGGWQFTVRPRVAMAWIGGDGFEQSLGAGFEMRRALGSSAGAIEFELGYDSAREVEPEFAYIDGDRREIAVRHLRRLPRANLTLEYRHGIDDRAGPGVSADRDRWRLRWRRALGATWYGDALIEYRRSDYDRLVPVREEQRSQAEFRATRALRADWQLALSYGYASNDSTDPIYEYRRHRLSVGAGKRFR